MTLVKRENVESSYLQTKCWKKKYFANTRYSAERNKKSKQKLKIFELTIYEWRGMSMHGWVL